MKSSLWLYSFPLVVAAGFLILARAESDRAQPIAAEPDTAKRPTRSQAGVRAEGDTRVPSPQTVRWQPLDASIAKLPQTSNGRYYCAQISPDGRWLLAAKDRAIDVRDTKDLSLSHSFPIGRNWNYPGWSPNSDLVAYPDSRTSVAVRSVTDWKVRFRLTDLPDRPFRAAWSPDGKWLVVSGFDSMLLLCDAERQKVVRKIPKDDESIFSLSFSPDSTRLAFRTQGEKVFLWNLKRSSIEWTLKKQGLNSTARFSPDGSRLAIPNGMSLSIRDANTSTLLQTINLKRYCADVVWLNDGKSLLLNSQTHLDLVDLDGELLHSVRYATNYLRFWSVSDSLQIATVDSDSNVAVWDGSSIEKLKAISTPKIPPGATISGRYSDLIRIHSAPNDKASFGNLFEFGFKPGSPSYMGNYWVYSAPNWYEFASSRIEMHRPLNPLPQPVEMKSGRSRIWLAFPGSI